MSAPTVPETERSAAAGPITETGSGRITVRSILIAIVLAVINDYWLVQLEAVRYSHPTYAAPFYNCVFILFVLTCCNFLIKRRFPNLALRRIELLTIYIMVSITSGMCSHNMQLVLVSLMGYAHFFQTPENQWAELFLHRLPSWLVVSDMDSLRDFYYGNSTLYSPQNFRPWIIPVLSWSAFAGVALFTMLCINSILRKQWVEAERLTFPIIQLPLEMTEESGSLFRNRHMWIGFAIAGGITLFAGLNYLYPSIPCITVQRRNIGQYLTSPPWNAMGLISMGFYFWAIGIAFLMPLELSFSCWFFYWVVKLELVFSNMLGLHELTVVGSGFDRRYPFVHSQAAGAYMGFFLMSMWASRRYLARVFRTAFLGTKEEDESREAISYRAALLGVIGGFIFMCLFAYQIGMHIAVILVFFATYLSIAVIISRIRAELGFPVHDMHPMGGHNVVYTAVGTQNVPTQTLVGFSLFTWATKTYASHQSPHQLESFKVSERTNTSARGMFIAVMIAGLLAMPFGFWMFLHVFFINGGATANMEVWALGHGSQAWNQLAAMIKQPQPPGMLSAIFVGIGLAISMFLAWMRMHFLSFPFHPLAYALAPSWGVGQLWMPLFIGSTAKFIALRFGGLRTYRKALPFFFGLILGEVTIGSMWTIIGIVLGIPTYDVWPGKYL